jgi:hypothetical protein
MATRQLVHPSALKGLPAAKAAALNRLVHRVLGDVVESAAIFTGFAENEARKAGKLKEDEDDGSDSPLPAFNIIVLGHKHVDAALLANLDGEDLLRLVRGHKGGPSLVDQGAVDRAVNSDFEFAMRATSFDKKAKARIYALLELVLHRALHPSTPSTKHRCIDRLIAIANAYDSMPAHD